MRWGHMTHTTEDWHNSPLPKGSSRALTVPSGRGGGRSGGPSGQTQTGTQDRDLQSRTDRQGPWRSWELWKPWWCRELWRPWWSWELWRPWQSWELWGPWRSWELWKLWQMVFGALGLDPLGPAPTAGPLLPRQKFFSLGKWGGIRSPPGLNRQDSKKHDRTALQGQTDRTGQNTTTGKPSRARQTRQDIPQEPEALLGWLGGWGFFWAWPGVRGPHRVPQRPPPLQQQGGRRLEWPPWPQHEVPPAPDESPWTRHGS